MNGRRLSILSGALPFLLTFQPPCVLAQPIQPPSREEATAALNPAAAFSAPQLDQMLAPIALYPDPLLMQVLMAATFPTQMVEAGQWLQDSTNAALKGDNLVAALEPLPWDPSVKSLVAFPQIVAMMNDHLDWTEALGLAFANQQSDAMARIQFLRQAAIVAGQLKSSAQITVTGRAPDIVIEPAEAAMVYVPVYNPAVVYGTWQDSDYPPVYLPPPPGFVNGEIGPGVGFSVGIGVVGVLWGWNHPDWGRHQVIVDPGRYNRITTPANTTRNNIVIQQNTWRRTGAVVPVPEPARPHRPTGATPPHPPGTIAPSAVAAPKPGQQRPPGVAAPGAPPATETHPEPRHPPGPPPAEPTQVHPEPPHPPGPPPAEPTQVHPEPPHPPGPPPAPAQAHPEPTHPPAEKKPPPAPAQVRPEPAHPPGPPPTPAQIHPEPAHPPAEKKPPEKKPPPRPGEEEKEQPR